MARAASSRSSRPTTKFLKNLFPALAASCEVFLRGRRRAVLGDPGGPISVFSYEGGTKASCVPMSRFTTRVQLNGNPTDEDYEKLHKAMKARGFSRVITSDDGDHYLLPHAEYDCTSNLTR